MRLHRTLTAFLALALGSQLAATARAQAPTPAPTAAPTAPPAPAAPSLANADWTEPFPPFRIAGNLYYVGSKGLASYLITTPKGHILINSDLEANVPMLRASIEKLGFKSSDIKILLISHAHFDHNAGSALIKAADGREVHGDER